MLSGARRAPIRASVGTQSKCAGFLRDRMSSKMEYVYVLLCADGSYYTGMTTDLDARLSEHGSGADRSSYTASRLPVKLVWSAEFSDHNLAFKCERRIKGWNRAKKEALIRGSFETVHEIVAVERLRRERARRIT